MDAANTITGYQLADFVDFFLRNDHSAGEWSKFMVTHYHDADMENLRRLCVRYFIEAGGRFETLTLAQKSELGSLASALR